MNKEQALLNPLTSFVKKKFGDSAYSHDEMESYLGSLIDPTKEIPLAQCEGLQIPWVHQRKMLGILFQHYIEEPPQSKEEMFSFATRADGTTQNHFSDRWVNQLVQNAKEFNITECNAYEEAGKQAYKPVIIAGSGPSLSKNLQILKDMRKDICLVSCLQNFKYFEDNGIQADYYVNLDAGDITLNQLFDDKKSKDHYLNISKNRTLISVVCALPELIRSWKGKVKWYNMPTSYDPYLELSKKTFKKDFYFNIGGNVLGSCLYFAQAVLGAGSVIFVGADFSYSYSNNFYASSHVSDSRVFDVGNMMRVPDVFGVPVWTTPGYFGFKQWFDFMSMKGKSGVKCRYINCTEGGILGSYKEGNIRAIEQSDLETILRDLNHHKCLKDKINNYDTALVI